MQKPLQNNNDIIDYFNELDDPKQTIKDQGYTLWPFFQTDFRLTNNVMEILIEPVNQRYDDYLARAIVSTRGYLDVPGSKNIAVKIPIKLPLDLTADKLIPFIEKTLANYSEKPLYLDIETYENNIHVQRKESSMKIRHK